jgi:CRP-like cAMP-binding protein
LLNKGSFSLNQGTILSKLLERWERRVPLSDDDRRAVAELPFTRRTFSRDSYLVREGEPPVSCHLILSGFAYRQKLVSNGTRQIISVHIPGELIDAQNMLLPVADHNVQSLGRSEMALVPISAMTTLMANHPAVGRAIWLDTLIDSSVFREWVVNVGRRSARARIAHLLCELILRMRSAGLTEGLSVDFPFTQEQIADATGLTAVHTNRTLQALRKSGLNTLSSGQLTVNDWGQLAEVADFSERYLHHAI